MADSNTADDDDMAAADKLEPVRDGTPSSIESTPEPDPGAEQSQGPAPPQKRKGGRKPIYATSEERKQRNRQAQAAFRERRTEYIKQLEATIKQNEETLAHLQQSQRTAADECLMLRYKNSLLERILLEKGIDVQSELQMKTGSPTLGPGFLHPAPSIPPQPQLQRTALQRQQARRSGSQMFLPKLAPGQSNPEMTFAVASPLAHPTPSSHTSSPSQPSIRSPMAVQQGGITPPASAVLAQSQAQQFHPFARSSQQPQPDSVFYQAQQQPSNAQRRQQRPAAGSSTSGLSSISAGSHQSIVQSLPGSASGSAGPPSASSFYPSPFQKHFDQLDQEYETQHTRSLLDDPETLDANGPSDLPGTFPAQLDQEQTQQHGEFYGQLSGMDVEQQQQHLTPQTQYEQMQMIPPTSHPSNQDGQFDVDPNDPMLDADPFGLSASMHYPTTYSFNQHRRQR